MAFVYEKIPDEEKANLKIKFNKIKEKVINNRFDLGFFWYSQDADYEFPQKWTIDRDNNYILLKCGSYNTSEPPLEVYSVQALFIKDYMLIIEVFDENEGPGWVDVDIGLICVSKELNFHDNSLLKIIEDAFKITWVSKDSAERLDPDDTIESIEDVHVYINDKKIKFIL